MMRPEVGNLVGLEPREATAHERGTPPRCVQVHQTYCSTSRREASGDVLEGSEVGHPQAGMVHSANQQAKAVMAVLDPCSREEYMSAISLTLSLVLKYGRAMDQK